MKISHYISLTSLSIALILGSCNNNNSSVSTDNPTPANNETSSTLESLILTANGEDFIRQGFTSKDGWRIDFNHAYITLNDVIAYQTDPPFNAEEKEPINSSNSVTLIQEPVTVDLAEGDENASPIQVAEIPATVGFYNAITWKLVNNPDNNSSIVLDGQGVKDGQTVNFVLSLPFPLTYSCGEFVGDERKGIVETGKQGEIETTFHFDHVFGDGESPPEDELNKGAMGFEPLAKLAIDGKLNIDLPTLEQKLSSQDYNKLVSNLESLGHVGEGHCRLKT